MEHKSSMEGMLTTPVNSTLLYFGISDYYMVHREVIFLAMSSSFLNNVIKVCSKIIGTNSFLRYKSFAFH